MEIAEGLEIIAELPVLYVRHHKTLILADTHIGFEEEMADQGVFIPPFQLRKVMDVLEAALNAVDVVRVIIAGDFKHRFSDLGRVERKELVEVLTYLLPRVNEIIVVRGNHDNYLAYLKRKFLFEIVDHYVLDNYLIVHGHKPIPEVSEGWEILVFGHEHPSITVRDSIGSIGKFPCFLKGKLRNGKTFVTLPAVGAYQTGSRVTLDKSTYLSPILKEEAILEGVEPVIVDDEVGLFELPPLGALVDLI